MDSSDLERELGTTIQAKNTTLSISDPKLDGSANINIVEASTSAARSSGR